MKVAIEFLLALLVLVSMIALPFTVWFAVFRTNPEIVRIAIYNIFCFGYGLIVFKGVNKSNEQS